MVTEKTLMKFGLIEDQDCLQLKKTFKDNAKLKEIHIEIFSENPLITSSAPFMLLSRVTDRNIIASNDNDRFILKKNDKYETQIMNILFAKITECYYKLLDGYVEFVLKIQNIYYRTTVLN